MVASTSVKYFHSAMSGAPTLSGVAGTLIAVLDACLVNGFGLITADSLVVASGIATLNRSAGIGAFEADAVITVAGATPSGLNGDKRIIATTATSVTFDATGISNQTATGTITAKLTPAGWNKPFSGTNLAAYQSADVTSTKLWLRIDDTATTNGRIAPYETMSDINTGTGQFALVAGGGYWPKANAANATARGWTVIADSKTFWIWLHTVTASIGVSGVVYGFGDFASQKSGDAYSCFQLSAASDLSASTAADTESLHHSYTDTPTGAGMICARSYTALGGSIALVKRAESYVGADSYSGVGAGGALTGLYPNGPDNSLLLSRILALESSANLRGVMRGALFTPQICHTAFNWRDKIDGQGTYAGRKLMALKGNAPAGTASGAVMFFDITGPWA